MKLFFLLLPFLGINLFCHLFNGHKQETIVKVEKKQANFQMMPSVLLVDFN